MPRILAPTIETAPAASQSQLAAVKKQLSRSQSLSSTAATTASRHAHSYLGKNLAKLSDSEIEANRRGRFSDAKADAALTFAVNVVSARGQVSDADLSAVRAAGFADADIIEVIAHVALNTLTNYVNEVAGTAVDFPVAAALKAA
jgi:alkylhydroperoxidase family enzyme